MPFLFVEGSYGRDQFIISIIKSGSFVKSTCLCQFLNALYILLHGIIIITYFRKMNWKKDYWQYLWILGTILFWFAAGANFFDGQWNNPPDYYFQYEEGMTEAERQAEFFRVEGRLFWKILANTIHLFLPFAILVYGNWFYLVKNFLSKQKYWAYLWRLTLFLFLIAFVLNFQPELTIEQNVKTQGETIWIIPNFLSVLTLTFWVTVFTTPLYLSYNWFQQNAQLANLKSEKLETELSFLKSQINPHFFFNTLNNLYALTLENSTVAPEVILKLSDLMRYTIYDGRAESVSLQQEITFIENYLELQRIRLHKKSSITFQHNVSCPTLAVPPLLFVIFLENAFKHGVETLRDNAIVDIEISENEGVVKFYALNNYDHEERKLTDGLGLENVKRRLKLLFGDQYKLDIVDQENTYRVYLSLGIVQ